MTPWRHRSFQNQLRVGLLAVSAVTLLMACAGFLTFEIAGKKWRLVEQMSSAARIVGSNASAALAFHNPRDADEAVAALREDARVQYARICDAEGRLFAEFLRAGAARPPASTCPEGVRVGQTVVVAVPIRSGARVLGAVEIHALADPVLLVIRRFSPVMAGVLVASALVAALFAWYLQRLISTPVLRLAATAARISSGHDYSLRAQPESGLELDRLVKSFNLMLDQIQMRDQDLQNHREALLAANERLEHHARQLQEQVQEKEEANERLAEAQQNLIALSRQAGMAEIATGVLHNVGNVLNSLNVSASIAAGKIREFRVDRLVELTRMIEEHSGDVAAFLTRDPRGQRVLPYLSMLGSHLREERDSALRELGLLIDHVGHIKEIVATQQNYAKALGVLELVSLPELAEDALQIVEPGLERHNIRLERDYEANEPVTVERHNVLQILLNLLRNAKQAIKERIGGERRIRIRVYRWGEDKIRVSVADTGVGLPPENLIRIFSHGFTTRLDGHGFGLHSGAIAAKQMGGTLWAESDGPGLGATFTLELPLSAQHAAKGAHSA